MYILSYLNGVYLLLEEGSQLAGIGSIQKPEGADLLGVNRMGRQGRIGGRGRQCRYGQRRLAIHGVEIQRRAHQAIKIYILFIYRYKSIYNFIVHFKIYCIGFFLP